VCWERGRGGVFCRGEGRAVSGARGEGRVWAVEVVVYWEAVSGARRVCGRVFDGRACEAGGGVGAVEALGIGNGRVL
jgi:hypothetical protein